MRDRKIICIFGPTATGKTDLAIRLVQQLPCEIISVDSAMVYCGMDIGTAKPTPEQLAIAPHRLINIRDPAESYSAGQFCSDANQEIAAIFAKNKIPLLVGGTMLYFRLLQQGFSRLPCADQAVREAIDAEARQHGWPVMHQKLLACDPETARQLHPNDSQRIQRALEIFRITGSNMTALKKMQQWQELPFKTVNVIVSQDRPAIHHRIEKRFDHMLAQGLLDEAKALYERGDLNVTLPSMRMVGYRQLWEYFSGKYTLTQAREHAIIATRQLAKRQFTWLNQWQKEPRFHSGSISFFSDALRYIKNSGCLYS